MTIRITMSRHRTALKTLESELRSPQVKAPSITETKAERQLQGSLLDTWAKRLVLGVLGGIRRGRLVIEDQGAVYRFGDEAPTADPVAHVYIHHASAWRDVLLRGSVGAGEAFMLGAW